MMALRVKLFQGSAGQIEEVLNQWLDENPKVEVRDIKVSPADGDKLTALVLHFLPKESKGLGFAP